MKSVRRLKQKSYNQTFRTAILIVSIMLGGSALSGSAYAACTKSCSSTVTCTAGATQNNSYTDPFDGTYYPQFDTAWSCSNGETVNTSNNTGDDRTGQTFSFCADYEAAHCIHRNQVATNGGPVVEHVACVAKAGFEFWGNSVSTYQQELTTPDGNVVRNFSLAFTPVNHEPLIQFQGQEALASFRIDEQAATGGNWYTDSWGQNPFPTAQSGECKPTVTCTTCRPVTCTYVNTTRVNATTEYSTYSCDNGGTYQTPNYMYVGVPPYPSSRWYYANTTIQVRASDTIGGDQTCTPVPACGSPPSGLTCTWTQNSCSGSNITRVPLGAVSISGTTLEQPAQSEMDNCAAMGGSCVQAEAVTDRFGSPTGTYKLFCHNGGPTDPYTTVNGSGTFACGSTSSSPPSVVNGACSATPGVCSSGTVTGDNGQTACGTTRSWTCDGSGTGHTDDTCNVANAACPPAAVNGTCNNATPLGCSNGTPITDNGQTACGTTRSWVCQGANGGSNSGTCNYTNAACPPAGCGTSAGISTTSAPSSNLCAGGTASGVTQNGSLWEWTCTP